jgi:hypothetical protein
MVALGFELRNPLAFVRVGEGGSPVGVQIVVEQRTDVIADDVLNDLDVVLVCQGDEVAVVLEAAVAVVRVSDAVQALPADKVRVNV